jgi:tRNA A-37 threonylcarbamoyl transferase component Bud32
MTSNSSTDGPPIKTFGLEPGLVINEKYEVVELLGAGWEGEVYKLLERHTGILRAGKFFFPHRNIRNKSARIYAKKLHKLRHCPILIQYHTQETYEFEGRTVTFLVSEFVEGELLSAFINRQRKGRITAFQGLHLLHALATGMAPMHAAKEYHGDLHMDNIIIRRYGISFDLKLLDMFHYGAAKTADLHDDVCDLIRLFYDAIGGRKYYAQQPPEVKAICCGLKRSLILKKYRTAGQLKQYLETMRWN